MIIHTKFRWLFTFCLLLLYLERSYGMSYYIVTYLIGFYLVQLVLEYFTPKGLDESDEQDLDGSNSLIQMWFRFVQPWIWTKMPLP